MGTSVHLYYEIRKKITDAELLISCSRLSNDLKGKVISPAVFLEQDLLSGWTCTFTYISTSSIFRTEYI